MVGSSDPIGSFEFLPTRGARPNQNKCVGSSDKVSEVPITIGSFDFLPSRGDRPNGINLLEVPTEGRKF